MEPQRHAFAGFDHDRGDGPGRRRSPRIGAAVALAVAGARVLAVDLHKERVDETVATISAGGNATACVADLPSDDAPETIVPAAVDAYGSAGANQSLSTHTHASGFDRRLLHTAVREEKQCLP